MGKENQIRRGSDAAEGLEGFLKSTITVWRAIQTKDRASLVSVVRLKNG